jgi:hypothetical protein
LLEQFCFQIRSVGAWCPFTFDLVALISRSARVQRLGHLAGLEIGVTRECWRSRQVMGNASAIPPPVRMQNPFFKQNQMGKLSA